MADHAQPGSSPADIQTEDPSHWEVVSEQPHADCKVYQVVKQHCRHPKDGREGSFFIMKCPDWIQAIPLTPEGHLILVNQYRHGSQELSWEVPGGMMDAEDASPETAGARELVEETGYTSDKVTYLGWCYPNPALQENKTHFVLYENCVQVTGQSLDPNEELSLQTVPVDEALAMVQRGEITHCIAMNALFLLKQHLDARA